MEQLFTPLLRSVVNCFLFNLRDLFFLISLLANDRRRPRGSNAIYRYQSCEEWTTADSDRDHAVVQLLAETKDTRIAAPATSLAVTIFWVRMSATTLTTCSNNILQYLKPTAKFFVFAQHVLFIFWQADIQIV